MSKEAMSRDLLDRYTRLEAAVRDLKIKMANRGEDDAVEEWQSLAPYLGSQWLTYGTLVNDWFHARFYQDRERVYFEGIIECQVAGSTTPVASMPVGYRPTKLTNMQLPVDFESSPTATHNKVWVVEALPVTGPGAWSLDAHPDFPLTSGGPPQFTNFFLNDLSYRIK